MPAWMPRRGRGCCGECRSKRNILRGCTPQRLPPTPAHRARARRRGRTTHLHQKKLGGQRKAKDWCSVFSVSQSVIRFHGPAPRSPTSTGSQSGSATPGRTRSNTSTEYSFPGATVLFQISTADKTHVFIPCVCPLLVSVLFGFSRGHPAPRSFFGGTVHSGSLYGVR